MIKELVGKCIFVKHFPRVRRSVVWCVGVAQSWVKKICRTWDPQVSTLHCTVRQKGPIIVVRKIVTFCSFWTFFSFKKLEGDRLGVT